MTHPGKEFLAEMRLKPQQRAQGQQQAACDGGPLE